MREKVEFENEYLNGYDSQLDKKRMVLKVISALVIIILAIIIYIVVTRNKESGTRLYEAISSNYEVYCENKAYILNKETIINYDKTSTIITLAESNKRVAAKEVIAMYKTEEYDNNQKELESLDRQINEKLSLLPTTYSSEIVQVENEINNIVQGVFSTSSYIKMNEYKSKLDELAYKKAKIIASLDVNSAELNKLIEKRDEFKSKINSSLKNINSDIAGVVVYKLDSNENKFDTKEFNLEKINKIKEAYDARKSEVFGIKIVDNFESFIIIEDTISQKDYMKIGNTYNIELLEKEASIKGTLIQTIENGENVYCIFRITNGIENIVDVRTTDIKVIWKEYNGFWVNNTSITKKGEVSYVTILSLNEYLEIPVQVIVSSQDKTLVKNFSKAELEKLGIERRRNLILYDRIVSDVETLKK